VDPPHAPQGLSQKIVTEDQAFMTKAKQRGVHTRGLIDHVQTGQALRCVRGIDVNDETVGLETMKATCLGGPGHYLGSDQTLGLMQTEYIYPTLADRTSPKEWEELEKPDLLEKATARKEQILSERPAAMFDAATDREIRSRFPIHLSV
ncbi:MAG: trimethylamine methyltransferase family protein, partial [Pseudomonadota bacterium]